MLVDIRPDHLQIVLAILHKHVPRYAVWAFGSRAKWTAKDYSDLDLCVVTDKPLSFSVLGALAEDFSESDLPWKVDVVDWATTSEGFRKIIERDKVVLQKGLEKQGSGVSSEWPLKELVTIADEVTVGYVGPMASEYVESGVPFLRSLNVEPFGIKKSDLKYVTQEFHQRIKKSSLRPGDVVIVRTGKPGTCAVIPSWLKDANCSDLVVVRCGKDIRPRFLCYWVNSVASHHISSHTVGAVQQHFNVGAAKTMKVAVPALPVQDKVVELLGAIDDRIALLRETNATLEAIAQALFKSWFVDFDPVRAKQQGLAPEGMDDATAALFPDGFEEPELGRGPTGWQIGTLADMSVLNPESWTAKKHPELLAYIDLANAKDNEIGAVTDYPFEDAPSRARRVLRNGDTIIGTVRPGNRSFAFIQQASNNLTASTGFAVLRPKHEFNTEFVYLSATQDSAIDHLAHVADGGAYPAVRPEVVAGLPCVVPPENLMRAFHDVTAPLLSRVVSNQQQAQTLTSLRDTLLPRLISGQLRLPEAEAILEDA